MDDIESAIHDSQFCYRVTRYLDAQLPESELRILSRELVTDSAKQALFAHMCILRAGLVREGHAWRTAGDVVSRKSGESFFDHADHKHAIQLIEQAIEPELTPSAEASMDDAAVFPAMTDSIDQDEPESITLPEPEQRIEQPPRKWPWVSGLSSAAVLLIGLLVWSLTPGPHTNPVAPTSDYIAKVDTSAGAVSENHSPIKAGTKFKAGSSVHLTAGSLQLHLARGTSVVVTGPADLQIVDGNSVKLFGGALVARVPVPARGFMATCPGLNVIDLGTEFGMRADPDTGKAILSVFRGRVQATAVDNNDQPIGVTQLVTEGHAVHHDESTAQSLVADNFDPTAFIRTVEEGKLSVPAHGTGVGVPPGLPDPQWRLVSVPGNPNWTPRPALRVKILRGDYTPNRPAANWISIVNDTTQMPVGTYIYETSIDLSGFDPGTVTSAMNVAVDDYVIAVRINGETAEFKTDSEASYYFHPRALSFVSHGWREGQNKVEVIVMNRDDGIAKGGNPTALQLQWTITARPIVKP